MTPPVKLLTARLEASLAMEGKMDTCQTCNGDGWIEQRHPMNLIGMVQEPCPTCTCYPPKPSPAYLAGFAAALTAASAAVLQENADGWGWMWPGREELAARIRGLVPSETEEQT